MYSVTLSRAIGPLLGLLLMVACTSSAQGVKPPSGSAAQEQRAMVMVVHDEPTSVAQLRPISTGFGDRSTTRLFNAGLLLQDAAYVAHPYLAENIPRLDTDTWRVFPDGSMETVYHLKPNLTWHDGQPLTARDFAFAWEVFSRPDAGVAGLVPFPQIADVRAPDDSTVLIAWRGSYLDAGAVYDSQFVPLPRHLLEATFVDRGMDALVALSYWTTDFVGAGPYKLERWEPGTFLDGVGFEHHILGSPKIHRVHVRFIADENAVLANFVAGEVDVTASPTLRYDQVKALRSQSWKGTAMLIPIQPRWLTFQFRPGAVDPSALADVHVRKALAYAIDKPSLDAGFFDGSGAVTYSMVSPRAVSYYAEIDQTITKYPYDPRQVDQLMREAGYIKGGDGSFGGADGQRVVINTWTSTTAEFQRDQAAISEAWQRVGFQVQQNSIPVAQNRDNEFRSTRPLLSVGGLSGDESFATGFTSSGIPSPANRWQGGNRGGWSNAEYDRVSDAYNSTLDRNARNSSVVQLERIVSEELPIIMLWHNFHVVAYASAVTGPDARGLRDLAVWNIYEWELQ